MKNSIKVLFGVVLCASIAMQAGLKFPTRQDLDKAVRGWHQAANSDVVAKALQKAGLGKSAQPTVVPQPVVQAPVVENDEAFVHAVHSHRIQKAVNEASKRADDFQSLVEDNEAMIAANAAHVAVVNTARSKAAANKAKQNQGIVQRTTARANSMFNNALAYMGLYAPDRDVRGLQKMMAAGIEVDFAKLPVAHRIALVRQVSPVSRWQATQAYAGAAAATVQQNIARLAIYIKNNPSQALQRTVATAAWAAAVGAAGYGLYKGAKALYAWATTKKAVAQKPVIAKKTKQPVVVRPQKPNKPQPKPAAVRKPASVKKPVAKKLVNIKKSHNK